MHRRRRQFVIRLKAKRKKEVRKLREAYKRAASEEEKKRILEKALKINPNLTAKDFIKSL